MISIGCIMKTMKLKLGDIMFIKQKALEHLPVWSSTAQLGAAVLFQRSASRLNPPPPPPQLINIILDLFIFV